MCSAINNPRAINIAANRAAQKWTRREQVGRLLWAMVYPLFRLSPRPYFWGWRRAILRSFGAKISRDAHIHPTVKIAIPWNLFIGEGAAVGDHVILYSLGPIRIGARSTISQGAHLCAGTHEWRDQTMPLLKPPIEIGADVWVCAEAFIGPGVTIEDGAIIAARAVVVKDVAARTIIAGNPAQKIRTRDA
jgi:putative colanic acid biosynthesis acetyltransferase WcaF